MPQSIKDVIENTKTVYMSDSALNTLLDFERIIDELDIYSFDHWMQGEVVAGPEYEKYFVTVTFMWPYKKRPHVRGAQRLADYDCIVKYKKEILEYPIKVKTSGDFEPGTKMPKMGKVPVWLVTITVPKKLMQEIHRGSLELEGEKVDSEDIQASYEQGLDDKMYQNGEEPPDANADPQQGGAPQGGAAAPMPQPPGAGGR